MAKRYERVSRQLPLKDADRLWLDLAAYRKKTGQKTMYARQRYGSGWAIFEVIEESEPAAS
jgi:hypothetical protein